MKYRKQFCMLLAGTMTLALSAPALAEGEEGPWYAGAQSYVMERNIMTGSFYGFEPYVVVDRAMAIQALWNLEGKPLGTDVAQFGDVAIEDWYQDSAAWAQGVGIVQGNGEGNYDPAGVITRGELAVILYRYAQYKGMALGEGADMDTLLSYSDALTVPDYAAAALAWAESTGVINGRVEGETFYLDHGGSATRAELATMLMRLDKLRNGEILIQPEETPAEEKILLPPELEEGTLTDMDREELPVQELQTET